jgi:hypothetical protein
VSFLYRVALMVTRKQSYIDWANGGSDDGAPELTAELADETRTVYLAPESDGPPDRGALLDEFWLDLFEAELAAWTSDEGQWPQPLTREMFDAWFDVELTSTVFDLTPEEALSQRDVDLDELADALAHCAWCGLEVDEDADRFVAFALSDRSRLAHREGRTVPLIAGDDTVIVGVMSVADSDEARAGDDLLFRVCTTRCEKAIRKAVPKALRKMSMAATAVDLP